MKNKSFLFLFAALLLCSCTEKKQIAPVPVREDIEWMDVWLPNTNDTELPRVLVIGNSITRSYYPQVNHLLKGKAYVGMLCTSKSLGDPAFLQEIDLILKNDKYDVVHFNNGLHGWGYTEEQYAQSFPDLLRTLKTGAPTAKLIWATTTPIRQGDGMSDFDPRTDRVIERNKIASQAIAGQNVVTNDLFTLVIDHPEYYAGGDGTHLVESGVAELAKQVTNVITQAIQDIK
ncbi:MAG: SGNH/GDSL hydrolase family protein [Bacteroidales bacterium]|jgi:lysophospholipase L1-like esterase|nr:SGNH/GDSL hydrolase family protein [Bacteroidales bacterium]